EADSLRRILQQLEAQRLPVDKIAAEARAIEPDLTSLSVAQTVEVQLDSMRQDTILLLYARFRKRQPRADLERLEAWLKARTGAPKVRLVVE
ncbi:MAG: TIGR00341 family protein, partial [Bacteroidetes bacterium]